jgi:hypothetical protein
MIYLAFPGMGKTPLSLKNGKYLDLDFGYFRTALNVRKEDEKKILSNFAKLAKLYENDGYIVLTNEPKLIGYLKVSKVFLPKNPIYSARKLKVNMETVNEWISGWETLAKENHIPVIRVAGLDHYLK